MLCQEKGRQILFHLTKKFIEKTPSGTISQPEAKELRLILEKEKREAESAGDIVATIAIGLLLAGLAYLLYKLLQEEEI